MYGYRIMGPNYNFYAVKVNNRHATHMMMIKMLRLNAIRVTISKFLGLEAPNEQDRPWRHDYTDAWA